MPGFEIINNKERKEILNLFTGRVILSRLGHKQKRKKFNILEFEKKLSLFSKSKYALCVSSGTAAIKILLKAFGVKPGDEVITQAFNFVATVEAIIDIGAKPIIVDIDDSLNIDIKDLKKKITMKTKVIIPVHMLGVSCDIKSVVRLAKLKKIKVLEDNCEAFGAKHKKQYLGTIGDAGVVSLDFGKIITSGEGGVIFTNNKKIYDYCLQYHDHGHLNLKNLSRGLDRANISGFNYRMTEMQAVIGKVQLKKINYIISENRKRYKILQDLLGRKYILRLNYKQNTSIYDTFIFKVKNNKNKIKIVNSLKKNKLGTKNIPDALRWHCSYYWSHLLNKKQIKNSHSAKKKLDKHIAIPILLSKSLIFYKKIAQDIFKLN